MRLLGKIGSAADDVILPVFDLGDKGGPFGIDINIDPVSDRNRIGGTDIFQAEISFDLTSISRPSSVRTVYQLPVFLITNPLMLIES